MATAAIMPITRGKLVIEEEIRHVWHGYETASAYDVYLLQPGEYPFTLVNINHRPWVPGYVQPGNAKPGGPYYANAKIDATLVETYYESRLFTATSAKTTPRGEQTTYTVNLYAYELHSRKTLYGSKAKIVLPESWREDTYQCIRDLDGTAYDALLSRAVRWLEDHGYGDYRNSPHYHVWNRINANTLGGIEGYTKAYVEDVARFRRSA